MSKLHASIKPVSPSFWTSPLLHVTSNIDAVIDLLFHPITVSVMLTLSSPFVQATIKFRQFLRASDTVYFFYRPFAARIQFVNTCESIKRSTPKTGPRVFSCNVFLNDLSLRLAGRFIIGSEPLFQITSFNWRCENPSNFDQRTTHRPSNWLHTRCLIVSIQSTGSIPL